MYNVSGTKQVTTQGNVTYDPYQAYLAQHRQQYGTNNNGFPEMSAEQYAAANAGNASNQLTRAPSTTSTVNTGSAYGTALQGSLDSLGQMSDATAANANLIGAGANNGTDLVDRSTFQPYMTAGTNAANEWQALAGVGPNALTPQQIQDKYLSSAGVQAQLNTGQQALNANFGSKGLTGSSSIMKALTEFGQGLASSKIGEAQDRLFQMAGLGANAANNYASQLNQNYSTNVNAQLQNRQLAQTAANYRGSIANGALQNQTGLLASLGHDTSSLATQASLARLQAIANSQQDVTSTSIKAPIKETSGQTMAGLGASSAGGALGTAAMLAFLL